MNPLILESVKQYVRHLKNSLVGMPHGENKKLIKEKILKLKKLINEINSIHS